MIDFYATAIIRGIRTFSQVPYFLKNFVKERLEVLGAGELAK